MRNWEMFTCLLPIPVRNGIGVSSSVQGWEWEFFRLEHWSSLASFKPERCLVSDRFITLCFSPIHYSVWRLSWNKQKRYITPEPISIAYNVLNRLIYCIWDLGKWLNFYASLIFREAFQRQLLCTHNVNFTYLIFCFLIENPLYNSVAAGCLRHSLAAIHLFAQGLLMREKRAHVTWSWGNAMPLAGMWDRAQARNLFS